MRVFGRAPVVPAGTRLQVMMLGVPVLALRDFDGGDRVGAAIPGAVHAEADAAFVEAGGFVMVAAVRQVAVFDGLRDVGMRGAVEGFVEGLQV